MFWFPFMACPKCQGDIYIDNDSDGRYLGCLQCGYRRYLDLRHHAEAEDELTIMLVENQPQFGEAIHEKAGPVAVAHT